MPPRKRTLIRLAISFIVQSWTTKKCDAKPPLALHRVIEVERSAEVVIRLDGFDEDGDVTTAVVTSIPALGTLYQVSQIYNKHGYDPKAGTLIANVPQKVIGKQSRIVYKAPDTYKVGEWGRFQYKVKDFDDESMEGTVVIVPPSKAVVVSDFLLGDEEWSVTDNGPDGEYVTYERVNRGIMNFFIFASDKSINIGRDGHDLDIWYFELPKKFLGWHGIAYGGRLEFDLSSFSGDFSVENHQNRSGILNLVEIHCARCSLNNGEIYGFPLNATGGFFGSTKSFSLPFHESAGWLKDPKNSLFEWVVPTKCEMIEMLSGISRIRILGDFTAWYETVMIDNAKIVLDKADDRYQLPVCAQVQPDGRRCKCLS